MAGRILVVESAHNIGGSFTSIDIVLRWGLRRGLSFDVMSAVDLRGMLPDGVGWFRMPAQLRYPISKPKFLAIMAAQQAAVGLRLWRGGYDAIILNNTINGNLPALLTGALARVPMLQFIREFERDSRSWRFCKHRVDGFVAVSQAVRDDLIGRMRVSPSKILLAPEGINTRDPVTPGQRSFLRQMFQIPEDAQVLGFVGRLDWWKGYELFAEAALRAATQNPNLYVVMIGGASRGQEAKVEAIKVEVANAKLHDRFRLVGEVPPDEVDGWMRCMDVLVHTSVTPEPFGRVLLEAMAIGIPVISSADGGPKEIVLDGVTGRLTPSQQVDPLVDAMLWMFAEEGRAAHLGLLARRRCLNVFPEAVCALPPLEWFRALQLDTSAD